jgi:hypothetical protein
MNLVAAGFHFEKFAMAAFLYDPFRHRLRDVMPDFLEVSRLRVV